MTLVGSAAFVDGFAIQNGMQDGNRSLVRIAMLDQPAELLALSSLTDDLGRIGPVAECNRSNFLRDRLIGSPCIRQRWTPSAL